MSRLNWNAVGERFYETGLDRGVLYMAGLGFAWPGLISVSESPNGGEAKPYYIDGIKYANISSAEEFEATLEAFYSPPEFGPCDGTATLHNGLFVTQQPRKSFDLSYRTKLGNDLDGADHAYKIHLVYNALAAPSERAYSTMSDSLDPATFSWALSTMAPRFAGFRPTAHFVIDSRTTAPDTLTLIEDVLYGSETLSARIPSVEELLAIFSGAITDGASITYDGGSPATTSTIVIDGGSV